ncbi:MAG TPA: FHA domain-containing protein [Anaerolineales bacterium]|nr:FHA domain-containing protein [Anaerolineales bacterium]
MAPPTYHLVMRSGPTPDRIYPLEKQEIGIGRDVSNDFVINDQEISRRHARLRLESGGYLLEDLGSTNGTFVNGQRLSHPHQLRPGETIMLGDTIEFTFESPYDADVTMVSSGPVTMPGTPPPAPPVRETYIPPAPPPVRESYAPPPPPRESYSPPPPPRESFPPPPPPMQPAYSGRATPGAFDPVAMEEPPRKRRNWLFAGCGCLLLLACAGLIGGAYYFDVTYGTAGWCSIFQTIGVAMQGCP